MANVKDDGKKMDPLFPRLHISDAEKGAIRTPPRNKMSFNVPSQTTQRCISGSVSPILPLSKSNGGSLVPPASSYHDTSYKRSVFSSFGHSRGSTRMATRLDSYHSSGINLNISLTTVKQTIETTKCQTLCNTGQLKRGDYSLFKPQDFRSARNSSIQKIEDEDDYLIPSLSFGNRQHNTKHITSCQKQLKLTDKEMTQENNLHSTTINDIDEEPVTRYSDRVRYSEMLSRELSPPNPRKRSISIDEPLMLHDPNIRLPLKRKSYQENMAYNYKDGAKTMSASICPLLGDNAKTDKSTHEVIAPNNKCQEDHPSLILEDSEKNGNALEINNVSGYSKLTPEEVSEIIGQEEYCSARRVIIQQQREFQSQLFELHRLIKVQKLLAESPDLLLEDNFQQRKKYPSEDIYPHLDHHKKESYYSFPIDGTIRKDMDKRYTPNLIDLPPAPLATSPKQSPWCFLPPPGNQWLVPVRSPSEGLVYKPYTGPTPPPVGLMTPVYGMTLPPSNSDFLTNTYNITPTSYNQGISVFPSTPLFTSYRLPTIEDAIKYNVPIKTTCKENDLQVTKDELPLFPTTPMVRDIDKCRDEKGFDERIKVIKVVPRNPKLASESTARIFQFIQEERKHTE